MKEGSKWKGSKKNVKNKRRRVKPSLSLQQLSFDFGCQDGCPRFPAFVDDRDKSAEK